MPCAESMVLDWKECFPSLTKLLSIPLKNKRHILLKKLVCNRVSENCVLVETMTYQLFQIISITDYYAYVVKSSFSKNAVMKMFQNLNLSWCINLMLTLKTTEFKWISRFASLFLLLSLNHWASTKFIDILIVFQVYLVYFMLLIYFVIDLNSP